MQSNQLCCCSPRDPPSEASLTVAWSASDQSPRSGKNRRQRFHLTDSDVKSAITARPTSGYYIRTDIPGNVSHTTGKHCVPIQRPERLVTMSTPKIFGNLLVAICCIVATGPLALGDLITNGNFELYDSGTGTFDSWYYEGASVVSAATGSTALAGTYSAWLQHQSGQTQTGRLRQTVSDNGLVDFTVELDFAVLETTDTSLKSFSVCVYPDSGTSSIDALAIIGDELNYYSGGGWHPTGLLASATSDEDDNGSFGDGKTLVTNHLKLVGSGYGTSEQSLTITLTNSNKTKSYTTTDSAGVATVTNIGFLMRSSGSGDFLVDNVTVVPEPSTSVLLLGGLLGLVVCMRRRALV